MSSTGNACTVRTPPLTSGYHGQAQSCPAADPAFKKGGGSFTKGLDKHMDRVKITTPTFAKPSAIYIATRSSTLKKYCFITYELK